MLGVVVSGLIGWFIYRHVYRGYSLRKVEARELLDELINARAVLDSDGDLGSAIREDLEQLQRAASAIGPQLLHSVRAIVALRWRSRVVGWRVATTISQAHQRGKADTELSRRAIRQHRREINRHLHTYLRAVREVASAALYARLLKSWHLFHLPLYVFMLVATAVHVWAVHRF
jgi:hypothetical protein